MRQKFQWANLASVLVYYKNRANPPLTPQEFVNTFGLIRDDDSEAIEAALCYCQDGLIRVRSFDNIDSIRMEV